MTYTIRDEQEQDFAPISALLQKAFENHPYSINNEYLIVMALREANALTLSCVALDDQQGHVVGHIAFSPALLDGTFDGWYTLGPLAVLPEYQRKGIGQTLIRHGLERLQKLGANGCILVGDPGYYTRFGFNSYPQLAVEGIPAENLMAYSLTRKVPAGQVTHHEAFHI